jgi:uncharacterized protein (TIGR03032 family)
MPSGKIQSLVGDTPADRNQIPNPFHLHFTAGFRQWLAQEQVSLALTTYEGGKLIIIGPGLQGGTVVTERNFERCMALHVEGDRNIWISTNHHVWQLENGLDPGQLFEGQWDRVYLPRTALVTGGVDAHDIVRAKDGHLYGVITTYNCIARLTPGEKGSFSPYWRPPFIDRIVAEDRCHLNGMCVEDGELAYASLVAASNEHNGWRARKNDGGMVIDIRTDEVVAEGLCMPHTPRLHNGNLWFLEAGRGYICRIDRRTKKVERVVWRPGFLRGLRFHRKYAFVCCSAPRDETFNGLPLDEELSKRNEEARCALDIIDLERGEVLHSVTITGSVKEIYDMAPIENCRQPLLYGIEGDDIRKIVVLGPDDSGRRPKA